MKRLLFLMLFYSISGIAQQTDVVDFLRIEASLGANAVEKKIEGRFLSTFEVLKETDSIFMDAVNIQVNEIKTKNFKITFDKTKVWFVGDFEKGITYVADFYYEMFPKQSLYFFEDQIWTQGQGKYTSHWLPSIDDMNDKIEFDLTIKFPTGKLGVSNGKIVDAENIGDESWIQYNMQKPMSSYLVAFAIGDFIKKELVSNSGIPIELYYKPSDSLKVEPTYRYSKEIFDFLETEIGVPYPWQNYKQVPVRDFLYAGMENTTATFFSEAFVVDSIGFNDRNYVNVNAHELAHQWFGNLVTETSSEHHWLQEGFATYYALLAEKEIFGDDYFYWKLYQSAEQLKGLSDVGKGESLLNPKASSLTFYEKGAWALHNLREKIGDMAFKIAIKNYLEKYKFKNVSTEDFTSEIRKSSDIDISEWEKNWLQQTAFQSEEVYKSLISSTFIKNYFEISALRAIPFSEKKNQLEAAILSNNDFIGQEAIYQLEREPISETLPLYKKGFETENIFIRQAIALGLKTIPEALKAQYESLLNDPSYVTQEIALYKLWLQFPENRTNYLSKMQEVIGFQDKNMRQLWLALALVTENFKNEMKPSFLKELKDYSTENYSFEIREKSFQYLNELKLWDSETLKNLVEATTHSTWRFAKSSKENLELLLKIETYKNELIAIKNKLSEKAKINLEKLIQ